MKRLFIATILAGLFLASVGIGTGQAVAPSAVVLPNEGDPAGRRVGADHDEGSLQRPAAGVRVERRYPSGHHLR